MFSVRFGSPAEIRSWSGDVVAAVAARSVCDEAEVGAHWGSVRTSCLTRRPVKLGQVGFFNWSEPCGASAS